MADTPPPPPNKPAHQAQTVRCANVECKKFICMAQVVADVRTLGTIVKVSKFMCPRCKFENSFEICVKEAGSGDPVKDKTMEALL